MKTLYDILGIKKDATKGDIKNAHRRGVKKNHPDKGGDKEAFQEIQLAYDVLSNEKKREHYDNTGQTEMRGSFTERFASFILEVLIPEIEKSNDNNIDLIGHGIKVLSKELSNSQESIKDYEKHIAKIEKSLMRVSHEKEGVNFISLMIEETIARYKKKKHQQVEAVEFLEKALEEMKCYKYEHNIQEKEVKDWAERKQYTDSSNDAFKEMINQLYSMKNGK